MPSLQDVAKRAKVSPSTVSLALSGKGRIGELTRRRIHEVAAQMSYHPRGRGRRGAELGDVGLICPILPNHADIRHGYSAWVLAAQEELQRRQARPHLFVGATQADQDVLFHQYLNGGQLRGVVLFGSRKEDGYLDAALANGLPTLVVNRYPTRREFSFVAVDDHAAAVGVGKHLLAAGHRRLGLVHHPHNLGWNMDRCEGFTHAAQAAGVDVRRCAADPDAVDAAFDAVVEELMDHGVTAAMATNDLMALRLLDALDRRGVSVPQAFSVVGFDNLDCRSAAGLKPSSVAIDDQRLGQLAGRHMAMLLAPEYPLSFTAAVVEATLIEHDTTGPAAA